MLYKTLTFNIELNIPHRCFLLHTYILFCELSRTFGHRVGIIAESPKNKRHVIDSAFPHRTPLGSLSILALNKNL